MRTGVFKNAVDIFDEYVPGGSFFLDHLRRARADTRTLARTFTPWRHLEDRLSWLTLEVTNICNSNCIFCAYRFQNKFRTGRGIMSNEIFEKAIDDYRQIGGNVVGFTPILGEPLIDPNIIERVNYAKQIGTWAGFYTNGILLNRIDIKGLLNSGIDAFVISTAPLERSMYELVYRNKYYQEVLHGLRKLLMTRNLVRKDLRICIAFRSNIPRRRLFDLPDFRKYILPLMSAEDHKSLTVITHGFDTWGGQIDSKDMVGIMRLALPPVIKRRPCAWTFGLYVTWDGQVRACMCRYGAIEKIDSKDELWVGDVTKSSLGEIWFGDRVKDLHRRFTSGDLPIACQRCTMYRSC